MMKPTVNEQAQNLMATGITAFQAGDMISGLNQLRQAVQLAPRWAEPRYNLGVALSTSGDAAAAIACYRQTVALNPHHSGAWFNLGNLLSAQNRDTDAEFCYRQAIQHDSRLVPAYVNLAGLLQRNNRLPEALRCLQESLNIQPSFESYNNLGNLLQSLGRLTEAEQAYHRSGRLAPHESSVWYNLAVLMQLQGRLSESLAYYDQVLALAPEWQEARSNRSHALLLGGQLTAGFAAYEERVGKVEHRRYHTWTADIPRWQGQCFAGQTLIVYHEQGLGDALQFCRFLPQVKSRGGHLIFSTRPQLLRLFRNLPGVDTVLAHGQDELASHCRPDWAVPLMTLPYLLGTTLNTIPDTIPYLQPDRELLRKWQNRLPAQAASMLKVGIVWAGNPAYAAELTRNRTGSLEMLQPLFSLPGIFWFSLQKGPAAEQVAGFPALPLTDLTADLEDFADTAALLSHCDLVISVDTAVAHLAGALGKPVWLLLPYAPEWRWLLARADSPWYPTARLFRQSQPGDWPAVVRQIAAALQTLIRENGLQAP